VIGVTGVAMPGLRRAVSAVGRGYRGDRFDLQTEVLAGFLAALRGLDLDDLDHVQLASRPYWAAFRAGQALAYADADYAGRRRDFDESREGRRCRGATPTSCWPPLAGVACSRRPRRT
jgi:hypothetical protein